MALAGNRVVAEGRVATPDGGEAVLDAIAALAVEVAGDRPLAARRGRACPGWSTGTASSASPPTCPGVTGLPVRAELERRLGVPVRVDNDATCAAWAERAMGAATGLDDVVLVTLGTGIGGGVITGGRLTRGANGFAGEVGHMVVDRDGPAVPVRPAGLLGALRLGQRPGPAGPAGGGRRAGRRRCWPWPAATPTPSSASTWPRPPPPATPRPGPWWPSSAGGSAWAWPTWPTSSTPRPSSSAAG